MRLIDSHAHLDFPEFDVDRQQLLKELEQKDIGVIDVATDLESIDQVMTLATQQRLVWGALGLHPTAVTSATLTQLPALLDRLQKAFSQNSKLVALGEIGLDYLRAQDTTSAANQKAALRQFLIFAQGQSLPVIFHCREAYGDLLTMLQDYSGIKGVIHCFD